MLFLAVGSAAKHPGIEKTNKKILHQRYLLRPYQTARGCEQNAKSVFIRGEVPQCYDVMRGVHPHGCQKPAARASKRVTGS